MKEKKMFIRQYMIQSLAMSMLAVLWMLIIDTYFFRTERILKVVLSIMCFAFLFCFIESVIHRLLENHFWLCIGIELLMLASLFFVFGGQFQWFKEGQEWWIVIYAMPVYVIGYLLRLVGIHKDAEDINKYLEARKKRIKNK